MPQYKSMNLALGFGVPAGNSSSATKDPGFSTGAQCRRAHASYPLDETSSYIAKEILSRLKDEMYDSDNWTENSVYC